MRIVVGLSILALAACGEKTEAPAAPEAATVETAAAAPASVQACPSGSLPLMGVCADPSPALFIAMDNPRQPFSAECVWKTKEVKLSDSEALVFRAQDCGGAQDGYAYKFEDGAVKYRIPSMDPNDWMAMLGVREVPGGQTAEQVAMSTLANAPEEQRARCETKALPNIKVAGRAFQLGPKADLEKELNDKFPDEPWDACGANGVTMDSQVYWEGRDRYALYHMTGQDEPGWDPVSFTFYVRQPDGSWAKKD